MKILVIIALFICSLWAKFYISWLPTMQGTHTYGSGWNEEFKFQGLGLSFEEDSHTFGLSHSTYLNSYFNDQTLTMGQYDYELVTIALLEVKTSVYLGRQKGYLVNNTLLPKELIFGKNDSAFGAAGITLEYNKTIAARSFMIPGFIGVIVELKFNTGFSP